MSDKYVPNKAASGQSKLREWWSAVVESNFSVLYRAINDHFTGVDDRHTAEQVDYGAGKTVKAAIDDKADLTDLGKKADNDTVYAVNDLLGVTSFQMQIPGTVPGVITWVTVHDYDGTPMYKKTCDFTILTDASYMKNAARGWMCREDGTGCWCEFMEDGLWVDPAFVPSANTSEIVAVAALTEDSGSQYQQETLKNVLTKTNASAYTPTGDYHPATKKYVDDAVAGAGGGEPEVIDTGITGLNNLLGSNVLDQYIADPGKIHKYNIGYNEHSKLTGCVAELTVTGCNFENGDPSTCQRLECAWAPSDDAPIKTYAVYIRMGYGYDASSYSWGAWKEAEVLQRPGSQGYVDAQTRSMLKMASSYTITHAGGTVTFKSPAFAVTYNGAAYAVPQLQKELTGITADKYYNLYLTSLNGADYFSIRAVERGANSQEFTPATLDDGESLIGAFGALRYNETTPDNPYIFEPAEIIEVSGDLMAFDIYCRQSFPVDSAYYTAESCQKLDDPSGVMQAIQNAGYDNLMDFVYSLGRATGLLEG